MFVRYIFSAHCNVFWQIYCSPKALNYNTVTIYIVLRKLKKSQFTQSSAIADKRQSDF